MSNGTSSSAVVVGGSISGLLVARVLSDHFARVAIIERDVLPREVALRKGVPQAAHAHGLLASGARVLEHYFPGLMDDLGAQGAPRGDVVGDFLWFQYGHWKYRHASGLRGITVSRPCLETAVRARVLALPNVTLHEATDVLQPTFEPAPGRVTGVMMRSRTDAAERHLPATLVVDASGRGSQSPKWLAEWGFGAPRTITVKIDVGYATRVFERRPGELFNSLGAIVSGTPPKDTRYAAILAAEGNRWMVTLVGSLGDYAPRDEGEWTRFAATLPVRAVHELVTTARPLSDIVTYRFPANQRRLYERMPRFPAGYLVVGDGVCSFNPVYGQGMSVAAMEAQVLDRCLRASADDLAPRFFAEAKKVIDIPWLIATGEDLRFPQVEGTRPPGTAVVNRYLERVHAVASDDPVVCRKFFDVLNLLAAPSSLMKPDVAWRVLARRAPAGPGSPLGPVSGARTASPV